MSFNILKPSFQPPFERTSAQILEQPLTQRKHVPTPQTYQQKVTPSPTQGMRFNPQRNNHNPLWGQPIGTAVVGTDSVSRTRKTTNGTSGGTSGDRRGEVPLAGKKFDPEYTMKLTRKPVPEASQRVQIPPRNRKKRGVSVEGMNRDASRAGLRTQLFDQRLKTSKRKIVPADSETERHLPSVKIIEKYKEFGDPVGQTTDRYLEKPKAESVRTYSTKSTLKTFAEKNESSKESDFEKPVRRGKKPALTSFTNTNKFSGVPGGGYYPENGKGGLRCDNRPKNNDDVITYQYRKTASNTNTTRKDEQENYRKMIETHLKDNHMKNKQIYSYYRARRARSSQALSNFLYEKKDGDAK